MLNDTVSYERMEVGKGECLRKRNMDSALKRALRYFTYYFHTYYIFYRLLSPGFNLYTMCPHTPAQLPGKRERLTLTYREANYLLCRVVWHCESVSKWCTVSSYTPGNNFS